MFGIRRTIRRKLALLAFAGMMLLVAVMIVTASLVGGWMLEEQIHARLRLQASQHQALLNTYFGRQVERLALVASRTQLRTLLIESVQGAEDPKFHDKTGQILLDAMQSLDPEALGHAGRFHSLAIADARGIIVASTSPEQIDDDLQDSAAFLTGRQRFHFEPQQVQGRSILTLSAPMKLTPEIQFVLLATVDAEPLRQLLSPPGNADSTTELLVGSKSGEKIRLLVPAQLGGGTIFAQHEIPLLAQGLAGEISDAQQLVHQRDRRGVDVLAVYRPLNHSPWGLLAKVDVAEAHAPLRQLQRSLLSLGGALLVAALIGSFYLSRRFTRPIVELAEQADRLADGKFDARVRIRSHDELGMLQSAFNRMVEQLAQSYNELELRVRQRTAELDHERNLLHALMDHHPDVIYFKDAESRFLKVSGALAQRLKLADPAEAVGRTDADFFPVEYAWQAIEDERTLLHSGRPLIGKEERPTWPDGTTTWVSTTKTLLRDSEGNVIGTFGISHDIDAQKQAQEALRHSEQRTRLIIDTAHDAFVAMDMAGKIIDWNLQAEATFGWKREEVLGRSLADTIVPPALREAHTRGLQHFLATKVGPVLNTRIEVSALHRDGQEFPIELTISPVRLGETYQFNAFIHDITPRKRNQRRLAAQHNMTAVLAESLTLREAAPRMLQVICEALDWDVGALWNTASSGDALRCVAFWHRPQLQIPEFAQATSQMRFAPGIGLPGRVWANGQPAWIPDIVGDENFPRTPFAAQDGLHSAIGFPILAADGVVGVLEFFSREIRQPDRALLEMFQAVGRQIGLFVDRQSASEALENAKETAESANRAKSVFLATMSHEIRTPMNAIIGLTELVLESPLATQQREYLKLVRDSGESLLAVINDVLDFSKIEAGHTQLDPIPFDLRETIGDTMKSLAVRAHAKGLELTYRIAPELPKCVVGDRVRLRQVIINLVGNAIKFTPRGEVVLIVERDESVSISDGETSLQFAVCDTGIGIPADRRDLIFEAFRQADSSTTREYGGTGLGLAICSKLVELMGGRIWVNSHVGGGSTFYFTARLGIGETLDTPTSPRQAVRLEGLRVLVVDDNATNRRILEEVLTNWQMLPTAVASAKEALVTLRTARDEGRAFELVLTDCHMPEHDGFELARLIQQDDLIRSAVIMMLTSGETAGARGQCEQLGVSACLLKPIKQSELFDSIVAALGTVALDEEPSAKHVSRLRGLRILLAEDSLVNQTLAVALLERHGHHVTVVNTGREALSAVQTHSFDVVLMDVQMPEMDGLQATAAIRRFEQATGGHVPIVAMTAHAMRGDRERCLESGMDDYVAKPIRARELFAAIERAVGSSAVPPASTASTDGTPADDPKVTETKPTDVSPAAVDGPAEAPFAFDFEAALRSVGGDRQLLRELAAALLTEAPQKIEELRRGLREDDASAVRRAAHTIKSSARYFGAHELLHQAQRVEELASLDDLAAAATEVEPLCRAVSQLTTALARMVEEQDNLR